MHLSQYALLPKLHLYLPLEGDAVFMDNYPMYVRLKFHHVHPSICTLPFTIPVRTSIYGMGKYNRPLGLSQLACNIIDYRSIYLTYIIYGNINRYENRSVAVMV